MPFIASPRSTAHHQTSVKMQKMIFQTAALSAESLGCSLLSLASLSDPNYIVHCYRCQKLVDFSVEA